MYMNRRKALGFYPPKATMQPVAKQPPPPDPPNTSFDMLRDIIPYLDNGFLKQLSSMACTQNHAPLPLGRGERQRVLMQNILAKSGNPVFSDMLKLSQRFSGRSAFMNNNDMSELIKSMGGDEKSAAMLNMFSKMQQGGSMNPMDMMSMMGGGNPDMANMANMMRMMNSMGSMNGNPAGANGTGNGMDMAAMMQMFQNMQKQ